MQQLPKLSIKLLEELKTSKNLLAYSGGTDSNALFFILREYGIEFDIALVNYQTRDESDAEEKYAKELASTYHKQCFVHTCELSKKNFEHHARAERYTFFEKTIKDNAYDTLLTAHHLNDRLEWFLMQLGRGAGLVELLGMNELELSHGYKTIRPLLYVSKDEILAFLHGNAIKHFIDNSNTDESFKRNHIRAHYASSFINEFKNGVKKSFEYLQEDSQSLIVKDIKQLKNLYILKRDVNDVVNIRGIDKVIKRLGYLLSAAQRQEILKTKDCIISSQIAICFGDDKIYIAPAKKATMDKKFKEVCRIAKIPAKIRPYMYANNIPIL